MEEEKRYTITVKEAADILNVSKKTIYRRLRNNKLDGKKVEVKTGLKWYINPNSLDKAIIKKEVVDVAEMEETISIEEFQNNFQKMFRETVREELENIFLQENQKDKSNQISKNDIRQVIQEELQAIQEKEKGLWNKLLNYFR